LPYISNIAKRLGFFPPVSSLVLFLSFVFFPSQLEKTKNLLFNGTKAMMGRIWKSDALVSDPTAVSPAPGHQTLLKGQTRIGLDGRLQRADAAPGCAAAPSACCVCQRVSGSRKPCSRCERPACAACIRQCNICSERCCSLCTVTDYSERYERVLCCGCSS
ncbi:apoptosis regulatory protein Siva-like, partial [Sinocyclocheilus grahami]